ncbi:hypothetical protein, partial [uncultured Gammaproteobacteria bacterium]
KKIGMDCLKISRYLAMQKALACLLATLPHRCLAICTPQGGI